MFPLFRFAKPLDGCALSSTGRVLHRQTLRRCPVHLPTRSLFGKGASALKEFFANSGDQDIIDSSQATANGSGQGLDRKPTSPPGMQKNLKTLDCMTVEPLKGHFDWQTEAKLVSSFNADVDKKTIYVPGSPPKWTATDMPISYRNAQPLKSLDMREIGIDSYFAALRRMQPTYDYSRVHVDCDWDVLESLLRLFPRRSPNQFEFIKSVYDRFPETLTLHMVSDTLFIRKTPVPETFTEKPYLSKLMPAVTAPYPGIPRDARSVYSIEIKLGPLNCVVHFSPDALLPKHKADSWNTRLASPVHKEPTSATENTQQSIKVHGAGQYIPVSDLLSVQTLQALRKTEKHLDSRAKKRGDSRRSKTLRHKLNKASRRSWARAFFTQIPATYHALLDKEWMICDEVRVSTREMTPNGDEIQSLSCLCSLLIMLKDAVKRTKPHSSWIRLSKVGDAKITDQFQIDFWKPESDEDVLRAHDVAEHHRMSHSIVSDEDYQLFWRTNGNKAPLHWPVL